MQIERKGAGPWPDVYVEDVTVGVAVGKEKLAFDCAALQGDMQVEIDVVMAGGHLAVGASNGGEYVANLVIPPKRYVDRDLPMTLEDEAPLPEGVDPAGLTPKPVVETVALPLSVDDMEAVRLILWTVNPVNTEMEMF